MEEWTDIDLNPYKYLDGNYVVVDFETTNLDKGDPHNKDNRIVHTVWEVYRDHKLVRTESVRGGEFSLGKLVEDIENSTFCVAHNAKFEAGWLRRCGLDIDETLFFCTMLAEYVILGNNRRPSLSLDAIADRYGLGQKDSFVSKLIKAGVCPSQIPKTQLRKYCIQDVRLTSKVFKVLLAKLKEQALLPVQFTRCILSPVLVSIESRGMHLDKQRVTEEYIKYEQRYEEITRELSEFSGGTNFNSPKQVSELVYDKLGFNELRDRRGNPIRTAKDGRKADIETLTKLKATNKRQRRFVSLIKEHSKVNAAITKSLAFFKAVVDETDDCVFYAQLNQAITKTHRLSSTGKPVEFEAFDKPKGIQLQNIARIFKRLFSAREPGWKIGEADGGQLEFRAGAFLGNCRRAKEDITNGVDVHQVTSDTLTAAGQPTNRQDAKSRTFKPLYGGMSGTSAEREYFDFFKKKYSGITNTQQKWLDTVEKEKKLRTVTGLTFYWPDTKWEGSKKKPYLRNTTSICNFPVQSLATADIIPIAVVFMHRRMKEAGMKSYIINTIHDSIIAEIAPGEEEMFSELVHKAFEDDVVMYLRKVYGIEFDVPLDTEVKIGEFWNE